MKVLFTFSLSLASLDTVEPWGAYKKKNVFKIDFFSWNNTSQSPQDVSERSPSGRTFCARVDGGWTRCAWWSCTSRLRPPWGGTCPGTEAAVCCHGTPLYTANIKKNQKKNHTYKWGSSSPEFTVRVTQLLHNDSLVPIIAPTLFSYTLPLWEAGGFQTAGNDDISCSCPFSGDI